ncbi:hypothetical protein [Maribacter sp. 6B07]|uniref:hypothetical protein n=1 Tax=Maribacter sp. 6B07 TaxID=2045442 RepID=UPI0015D4CA1E|nr:hypothetical protein [Maribacter sp. 6B07]
MSKKVSSITTFILGVISLLITAALLFNGRMLIGIFAGITSIQLLKQALRKKTNANKI